MAPNGSFIAVWESDHASAIPHDAPEIFARRFDAYLPQKRWQRGPTMMHLPDMTVLIIGVGGSGSEASKQCAAFGMRVLGCDPRTTAPAPGMAELFTPDALPDRIGEADFR